MFGSTNRAQATAPAFRSPGFGSSTFGGQRGGSRVAAYTPTTAEADGDSVTQPAGKLESISAMQVYKDKIHEELRWEDYQLGDKGVPNSAVQPAGAAGFGASTQSNPFSSSCTFGQTSANPFSSTPATNPFGQKSAPFSNPGFAASTSSAFGSSTFSFGSVFGSASAQGTRSSTPFNSGLNFGNTQQSPLFQSTTPAIGQSTSACGHAPSFGQTTPASSTGFGGNMYTSLLRTSSPTGFFCQTMPSQYAGAFGIFGYAQADGLSGFGGTPGIFGHGQSSDTQNTAPEFDPFGPLPEVSLIEIGDGISGLLVGYCFDDDDEETPTTSKEMNGAKKGMKPVLDINSLPVPDINSPYYAIVVDRMKSCKLERKPMVSKNPLELAIVINEMKAYMKSPEYYTLEW